MQTDKFKETTLYTPFSFFSPSDALSAATATPVHELQCCQVCEESFTNRVTLTGGSP